MDQWYWHRKWTLMSKNGLYPWVVWSLDSLIRILSPIKQIYFWVLTQRLGWKKLKILKNKEKYYHVQRSLCSPLSMKLRQPGNWTRVEMVQCISQLLSHSLRKPRISATGKLFSHQFIFLFESFIVSSQGIDSENRKENVNI